MNINSHLLLGKKKAHKTLFSTVKWATGPRQDQSKKHVFMFYYFYLKNHVQAFNKDEDITEEDIRHKGKNITNINNLTIKEVRN